ncbi:MAG: ankyrin repeat domain-containing protein [Candidatus Eremiobacteraeota bacterium]|nr:ankyrin repeat domain-containing protein [Candidatus Eremiobacteraeota bacterium]
MPSKILAALYERKHDEAAAIAAQTMQLDVFEAAAMGDAVRLRDLLAENAECATMWSDDGFTPLHLAAFFAKAECVRALIDTGADVDAQARNSMAVRALHSAVTARSLPCVELLLEGGADPNARQTRGYTPLHSAVNSGDAAIERALLDGGADPTLRADDGREVEDFRRR